MKYLKTKSMMSITFLTLMFFLIELIFRIISGSPIFCFAFLRIAIGNLMIGISFGFLTSLLKNKLMWIINAIIVFCFCAYAWAQAGFVMYIGVYMSLNVSGQFDAVKDYIGEFLSSIALGYYTLYIPFIIGIVLLILKRKLKRETKDMEKLTRRAQLIKFGIILNIVAILCIFYGVSLGDDYKSDPYQAVSNRDVFLSVANPGICIKEFGIIPYAFIDVRARVFTKDNPTEYASYTYDNINKEITDYSRKIDDSAWNEVIASEKNKTLNQMNNYYISKEITDKNDYTGMFKGKNLLVIMMESTNDIILNEEYYPNFYKLATNGWYFENNYSPRNSCATGNNEFSAMTGLYSIHNTCTVNNYTKNTYPYAIFNLFNNKGYMTNSFHDYTESYYNRKKFHKEVGSMNYYNANSLKMSVLPGYGGWASDEEFIDKYFEKLDELDKTNGFMTYWTTMTTHQPYSQNNYYDTLYIDMFKDTGYHKNIQRYMSKLKVLDNALGKLVSGLEERNLLDDTVIVLFGDHYPYGLGYSKVKTVLSRNLDDGDIEKTPLVIYNPSLEAKTFETYTSYINLLPTLANLFDLDYDPRLYAGEDIFSKDYSNYVVFADSSWKNDEIYYNVSTGKVTYYVEDSVYDSDKIKEINSIIYDKMNSSTISIKKNYFNYLNNAIKNVQNEKNESVENEEKN